VNGDFAIGKWQSRLAGVLALFDSRVRREVDAF
jgi:hypothetical protein